MILATRKAYAVFNQIGKRPVAGRLLFCKRGFDAHLGCRYMLEITSLLSCSLDWWIISSEGLLPLELP